MNSSLSNRLRISWRADRPGVITSNSLAVIEGIPIDITASSPVTGEFELAGYRVEVDSRPCRLTHVGPEGIVFLVAEGVRPSEPVRWTRTLLVQGPMVSRFIDVVVERFYPRLVTQNGFVVATAGLVVPQLYVGEPIPVGNYVTIRSAGILTGNLPLVLPGEPVIVLERDGERHELPAIAYPVAGFAGAEIVAFTVPGCFSGEYELSVAFAGYASNAGLIRFTSSCSINARPERIPRTRRP